MRVYIAKTRDVNGCETQHVTDCLDALPPDILAGTFMEGEYPELSDEKAMQDLFFAIQGTERVGYRVAVSLGDYEYETAA